jgi:alpha-amylase
LEARHPEFLMLLEEMVLRKQLELLGGAFFAPVLPLIPGSDRLGQIELLTTYIRKAFGKRPRGCWLHDYAWEPSIASTLQTCGFDFTFLPERHFALAGVTGYDLGSPVMTEDQGKSVAVFPVFDASENFPEPLPPAEAMESVKARFGELPLYTLLYPGQAAKFLWEASGLESPDVFFERSFAALQREGLEYETTTPSRHLKGIKYFGRAYFPGFASAELMAESVPSKIAMSGSALSAGSPRRLLLRHEESLALYAKMQYVRILVGQLRGDKSRKKTAQEELWRGQCGDAYWPGKGGGIRRLPVRAAAYAALIESEKTTRQRGSFAPGIITTDIDFDGEKEILYQGSDFNAYIHLHGGCLTEFDSFRTGTNYANVMDGAGLRRSILRDHFCDAGGFGPDSGSFALAHYTFVDSDKPSHIAKLTRDGWFESGGRRRSIALRKAFAFRKGGLSVQYEIENKDTEPSTFRFVVELNVAAGFEPDAVGLSGLRSRESVGLDATSACGAEEITGLRIENKRQGETIEIRADEPFSLSHSPVFSDVAGCFCIPSDSLYQGCLLLLGWDFTLPPDASRRIGLTFEFRS